MYIPAMFEEPCVQALHALMHEHSLATLVWRGTDGLVANHLPFEVDPEPAPFGVLRAHMARANPLWQQLSADDPVMVLFQGVQSYISPSWYETKRETGQVVPTWNYMVVHAHGPARVVDDPAWLRALVERLTNKQERQHALPWQVDDAPREYIDAQLQLIVGIEIPIARLEGKWKLSQNKDAADRAGVVQGLLASGKAEACAMAARIEAAAPREP